MAKPKKKVTLKVNHHATSAVVSCSVCCELRCVREDSALGQCEIHIVNRICDDTQILVFTIFSFCNFIIPEQANKKNSSQKFLANIPHKYSSASSAKPWPPRSSLVDKFNFHFSFRSNENGSSSRRFAFGVFGLQTLEIFKKHLLHLNFRIY